MRLSPPRARPRPRPDPRRRGEREVLLLARDALGHEQPQRRDRDGRRALLLAQTKAAAFDPDQQRLALARDARLRLRLLVVVAHRGGDLGQVAHPVGRHDRGRPRVGGLVGASRCSGDPLPARGVGSSTRPARHPQHDAAATALGVMALLHLHLLDALGCPGVIYRNGLSLAKRALICTVQG